MTITPAGVLTTAGEVADPGEIAPPMPSAIDVWLPKGWHYNGAKLPTCTLAALTRSGPAACPPKSLVGQGTLGPPDPGDASTPSRMSIFNGGPATLLLRVVIQNPARVAATIKATLTKVDSPRWSSRLHADIPASLQVVSGIPISLRTLQASVRSGGWFTTTYCPHVHRWRTHLQFTYPSGQVADGDGSVSCRTWPPRRPLVVP